MASGDLLQLFLRKNLIQVEGRLANPLCNPAKAGKWQLNLYDPDGTRVELTEFTPVQ